jgi:hypothetical protein
MPIEIDWEVTDAPSDDDSPPARAGRSGPPPPVDNFTSRTQPVEAAPPDPGDSPSAGRAGRLFWLLLAPLVLVAAVAGAGINKIVDNSWQRIRGDIAALVHYEEQFALQGQAAVVMRVQDPGNTDWLALRSAQLRDNVPASPPIPMLRATQATASIADIELLDADWVRADVERHYSAPDGQSLAFRLPQFYRRGLDNDWLRTAPPGGFWGEWLDWNSSRLQIRHSQRDAQLVAAVGPQLDALLQSTCNLWPMGCEGLPPGKLYFSGFVGSLEYDPLRNVKVLVHFGDDPRALPPDYFISVPSPHLAGLPLDAASRRYLVDYLAVRLIAAAARESGESPQDARALFSLAVSSLGLWHADPGYTTAASSILVERPLVATTLSRVPDAHQAVPALTFMQVSRNEVFEHTVQYGETLTGIAAQYGVSAETLISLNGLADPNHIQAGSRLIIWRRGEN